MKKIVPLKPLLVKKILPATPLLVEKVVMSNHRLEVKGNTYTVHIDTTITLPDGSSHTHTHSFT